MSGEQLSFDPSPTGDRSVGGERPAASPGDQGLTAAAAAADHPFPPTDEQATAIVARDSDVFLEAGAGTGKTRVLVDRYCDAVDIDEVDPARILAFTFTEKAAAEMRRRVRVELMRRARGASDPERRPRLEAAARAGEGAPISTIHGFCRRLLANHPAAAGLDPHFRVLDAEEAARLGIVAFERALDALAADDDVVARVAAGHRNRLGGLIRAAYDDLRNHGESRPTLPPLQITVFEGEGEEPPDPAEIEFADASYGAMRSLLEAYAQSYDEVKAERSGVDFDDLQLLTLELLEANRSIATAQRERFDHLLVDEFQDTSPLQVGLIAALQGPTTRLFTVGDEFQSIYAFRGADLASFREQRRRAREAEDAKVLPLSGSFRSTPEVVAAVNAVGRCLLADFRELRVGREPVTAVAADEEPKVELLLTERAGWKAEEIEISTASAETAPNRIAEARVIARRLRELATEKEVTPSSMVLLLRAFTHVDAYAEALELAGLDPYVVGGRGYWSAQQVEDALRLLRCVANPLDDEALFGALASPACGAGADALWILRRIAGRRRHIWPAVREHVLAGTAAEDDAGPRPGGGSDRDQPEPDAEELERRREAAEWAQKLPANDRERIGRFGDRLIALRRQAPLLPLDGLVERALETFDYDLAALAMPGGRRRAANLLKLIRIAAEYQSHEGRDLRGFLNYAADRAAVSDREAEATVAAEEHDGVTIMTIHAAKGLEFECVAVGDLGRSMIAAGSRPSLRLAHAADQAIDRAAADRGPRVGLRLARAGAGSLTLEGYNAINDEAALAESQESGRLAYVAASRARSRLILSGLYDPIDLDGGPEEHKPSHSVLARLLPGLGVSEAPDQIVTLPSAAACEGLEVEPAPVRIGVRIERAGAAAAADLSRDRRDRSVDEEPAPGGKPPMLALAERGGSAARSLSYAALADYNRCGYRFLTERVLGLSYGAAAAGPLDPRGAEQSDAPRESDEEPADPGPDPEAAPRRRSRLGFGRAVHELLERSARDGWQEPTAASVSAALGHEGVDPDEADKAAGLVSAWLRSGLLAELREAGASFRPEVPFRVEIGSETVMRGTIDLLAEVPGRPPLIVDYKTDSRTPTDGRALADGYLIQRALYSYAIAAATGAGSVSSAYFFLRAPESPVTATLDAGEIDAGRAGIESLVERIRARDFSVTDSPGAALCHDCPARARLCPHPPELTLAR